MIYKFSILSDEIDNFKRVIKIDAENTFEDLHKFITKILKYNERAFTTFYTCDDEWGKETEITPFDMDTSPNADSYTMDQTRLEELLDDQGQRLIYVFDMLTDRRLFLILSEILCGSLAAPSLLESVGEAPQESQEDVFIQQSTTALSASGIGLDIDSEFYGDTLYDSDELAELSDDLEGFGDDIL